MSLFPSANVTTSFEPTRAAALARLKAFLPFSGTRYANDRNADHGPDNRENVSTLSPYIRHRLITEPEVLEAVLGRFAASTAEKFIQEVYWRTYFKGHLETYPQIWARYTERLKNLQAGVSARDGLSKAYRQAIEGRTGIECFDAWVEELVETGYLHNHTRMWFASIWIFTLRLPWELGADFTYRHFIDGDPASNTLSWRWVGGLHTKGKTYLARRDNIERFTDGRFSPTGLAREAPPLDEAPLGPAHPRFPVTMGPLPARALLLLTEEDLSPETLPLEGVSIAGVAGATATQDRSALPVAEPVLRFVSSAMDDGLSRAQSHFGVQAARLETLTAITVADACRAAAVTDVVTAAAPTGPVAAALAAMRPALAAGGITLHEVHRPYDLAAWRYAGRGFFGLKERIPDLMREGGLA